MSERERPSAALRRLIIERAQGLCEYCRCPQSFVPSPFAVEHIVPASGGGETQEQNLAFSCAGCNSHKFTKTTGVDPQTGQVAALFHPRQHLWSDHFAWDDSSLNLVGRTSTGRATIEALRLNRVELLNLRGLLLASGEHPPTF